MSALAEIERKVKEAKRAVEQIGYSAEPVSAKKFYDYMTCEIFSDDVTTLHDVLDNEFLMIHEFVEISELKKRGRAIDKRVIVESPKTVIYEAYFAALEWELKYALSKNDCSWVEKRLETHRSSVLMDDPNLPKELRPQGEAIYKRFKRLIRRSA
jgi:hypothetical protein